MLEWFSGAVASAKAMKDIAQSLVVIRDAEMVKSKVFDLTSNLMDLQQRLMDAQMEQMDLIEQLRVARGELDQLKSKKADLEKYELHQFSTGSFAYQMKDEHREGEPEHFLCSNCYERGDRVTLQKHGGLGWTGFKCPRCEEIVNVGSRPLPPMMSV